MFNNLYKNDLKIKTFLNPYSYNIARKNKDLFQNFDIKIDGILLVKLLNIFGFNNVVRESFDMTSLAPLIFEKAINNNLKLYVIGTEPNIIDKAINNIKLKYPSLNIIGYHHGYILKEKEKIIKNIITLNPDIVICGMGTPLQEKFLLDLQDNGWNGIGYTCGGFLHQTALNLKYYPDWINKYNLRLFYRFYKEPKLYKRYFFEYPKFMIYFIKDLLQFKTKGKK